MSKRFYGDSARSNGDGRERGHRRGHGRVHGRLRERGRGNGPDARETLIAEIYECVLRPDRYDALMETWSDYVDGTLSETMTGLEDLRADAHTLGPFDDDPELHDHFRRALDLLDRMGRTPAVADAPLTQSGRVALLVSPHGAVLEASEAARAFFESCDDLDGIEMCLDSEGAADLRRILRKATQYRDGQLLSVVVATCPDGTDRHLAVTVSDRSEHGRCVVIEALEVEWCDRVETVLKDAFALSPGEVVLVRELTAGARLADIAERRGRSLNTLRAQLKSIFRKARCEAQADLVRIVATLSALPADEPGERVTPGTRDGSRLVDLPDGRRMEVHYRGPSDGRPVVFVHGMLDGTAVTQTMDRLLDERNLRFICPIRPSFGRSDPYPNRRRTPQAFAEDLRFLLDDDEIETVPVIGHLSGAVFAYAAAQAMGSPDGGRITGIACVGGGVPLVSLRQIRAMAPRQRIMAYTARFAPALLPTLLRAGISQIDTEDAHAFLDALYPPDSHDRAFVRRTELDALIIEGYRFAVQQGHRGFEDDAYHVTRDWSELTRDCPVPAIHLHGRHDPVVKIASVREFCARHDHAGFQQAADCGQLLFYEKPELVLDAVASFEDDALPVMPDPVWAARGASQGAPRTQPRAH